MATHSMRLWTSRGRARPACSEPKNPLNKDALAWVVYDGVAKGLDQVVHVDQFTAAFYMSAGVSGPVGGPVHISVADAAVTEADGANLSFAVTLHKSWFGPDITVRYTTSDGTPPPGLTTPPPAADSPSRPASSPEPSSCRSSPTLSTRVPRPSR